MAQKRGFSTAAPAANYNIFARIYFKVNIFERGVFVKRIFKCQIFDIDFFHCISSLTSIINGIKQSKAYAASARMQSGENGFKTRFMFLIKYVVPKSAAGLIIIYGL